MGSSEKPLGKMHKWWLNKIFNAPNHQMAIDGYQGSAYGNALDGLIERGYIKLTTAFERSGLAIYELTEKGIDILKGGEE